MTYIIPKSFSVKNIKNYHNSFLIENNDFKTLMVTICDLDTLFQNFFRFFKKGHKKVCPIFKTTLTFFFYIVTEY